MRHSFLISLLLMASTYASAQTEGETLTFAPLSDAGIKPEAQFPTLSDQLLQPQDTLHLPLLNSRGEVEHWQMRPLYWGSWHDWSLHTGLNLNFGASVFTQIGKHARGGAGFAQSLSAMYAVPLSKKMSLAVGGYFDNVFWMHSNFRDAGLSAVLGYKFDDHWEAYVYGQKSIIQSRLIPYSLYDMASLGDRIGAAVKYNVNHNLSFQVSVEHGWMPSGNKPKYFDQYNYPVQKP